MSSGCQRGSPGLGSLDLPLDEARWLPLDEEALLPANVGAEPAQPTLDPLGGGAGEEPPRHDGVEREGADPALLR